MPRNNRTFEDCHQMNDDFFCWEGEIDDNEDENS